MTDFYILEPIGNVTGRMIFNRKSVFGPLKERLKGEGESLSTPLIFDDVIRKQIRLKTKYGLNTRVVSLKQKIERKQLKTKSKKRRYYIKFKNPLEDYGRSLM